MTAAPLAALGAAVRALLPDRSWKQVHQLIESGKILVDGVVVTNPGTRVTPAQAISVRMSAPDKRRAPRADFTIVFEDVHLIVIDKPEGISSVPFDEKETGTAMDLIRGVWRRQGRRATATPLFVVHRIDKDTSGLLAFAKTKLGERGMHTIFKNHLADREYLAVAHGLVQSRRIESHLVPDRGDGIRGSTRFPDQGQRSVTHVTATETFAEATMLRVRLETGRTHQIRIHLAEAGHPLVGETVYIRDLQRSGRTELPSKRLLLHATTLGFEHPVTHQKLAFSSPIPPDFMTEMERLR